MHHNLIIKDGDSTQVEKEILVDGVLYIDEKPRKGSFNLITSGAVAEIVPESQSKDNPLMTAEDVERMIDVMKPIDAMTLRFEFSKKDYNPETAGVGSAGTWTKVDSPTLNIWDWTNEATDWHESFKGAFPDADNEVSVIAAGDTSDVTTVDGMFAGEWTGSAPYMNNYNLTVRNNIVSCVPFDVSSCTNFGTMFCATYLKHIVQFAFNPSITNDIGVMFSDTMIETVDSYDLMGITAGMTGFISCNSKLTKIGRIIGGENITYGASCFSGSVNMNSILKRIEYMDVVWSNRCDSIFAYNYELEELPVLDISHTNNLLQAFIYCRKLKHIKLKNRNLSSTTLKLAFYDCQSLIELPDLDTSDVTNIDSFARQCYSIDRIPDYDVSSVTSCAAAFRDSTNIKYGILEMYNKLLARDSAITDHKNCFKNCGINTPEGQAALAQIPQSWGGLAEG